MRAVPASLLVLAIGVSPALAQQMAQSPYLGHEAGAACSHGPYPPPFTSDNVNGYGMSGCLPGDGPATGGGARLPDPHGASRR